MLQAFCEQSNQGKQTFYNWLFYTLIAKEKNIKNYVEKSRKK